MADPTEPITTESVVASTAVDQELNLGALAMDLAGAESNPDRIPGLISPVDEPKATALIFRSGEVVITGAKYGTNVHERVRVLSRHYIGPS